MKCFEQFIRMKNSRPISILFVDAVEDALSPLQRNYYYKLHNEKILTSFAFKR
jgi:hypothetical protein